MAQEQKFESINSNNTKKFEAVYEKVNTTKVYLEQKIDAFMALENKLVQNKDEVRQVQDLMLRTKTDLGQQVADCRAEMNKQSSKAEQLERRMENTI